MKKIKFTYIKNNKKVIIAFTMGAIIFSGITAGATSLIYSKDVTYDNTSSGLSSTTVQGALDELYEQAKNGGASVSCDNDGNCTVTCKQGNPSITDGNYSCTNTTSVTCPNGKFFIANDTSYKCSDIKSEAIINKLNISVVTSGNGLYKDTVTNGRYYYRGSSVNNYITFNSETWRIISIESNGTLKIVRNTQLSKLYAWDDRGNRDSSTSTYCTDTTYGCNAWAATKNLIGAPNEFTQYSPNGNTSDSTNYTGTVTQDSTMATYLNETYYDSLSSNDKTKVVKGVFNVSTSGSATDTETLEIDAQQEKQYQWKGYIALYTITELLRASTSTGCTSLKTGYNSANSSTCKSNNWLWPTSWGSVSTAWTLSPYVGTDRDLVWVLYSSGYVSNHNARGYRGPDAEGNDVRPVLHLSSDITLSGTGTSSDPYVITN